MLRILAGCGARIFAEENKDRGVYGLEKTLVDGGLISDNDWFIWPGAADDPQRPAEPDYAWQPRPYGRYCPTPTALSLSCYWLNIRNGIVRLHDAARAVSWSTKVGAKQVAGCTGRLIECLNVHLEVSTRQQHQALRLQGTLVRGDGKVGHREMVLHRHDQQRGVGEIRPI